MPLLGMHPFRGGSPSKKKAVSIGSKAPHGIKPFGKSMWNGNAEGKRLLRNRNLIDEKSFFVQLSCSKS